MVNILGVFKMKFSTVVYGPLFSILLNNSIAQANTVQQCTKSINDGITILENTLGEACRRANEQHRQESKTGTTCPATQCLRNFASSIEGANVSYSSNGGGSETIKVSSSTSTNQGLEPERFDDDGNVLNPIRRLQIDNISNSSGSEEGTSTTYGVSLDITFQLSPSESVECVSILTAEEYAGVRDRIFTNALDKCLSE